MTSPARNARLAAEAIGFTEVHSRGRGHLVMRKPGMVWYFNKKKQQWEWGIAYSFDTSIGNIGWHYGASQDQEVDTAWVASSGVWDYEVTKNDFHSFVRDSVPVSYRYLDVATQHYVEITWDAVQWVNDEGDSENVVAFSQVTPAITDDVIRWNDIAPGWDVRLENQTARLAKWVTIDSLSALGTPTIGGTNIRLRFRLTFQRSSNLDVYVDGVRWAGANNTWAETSGDIEFRDATSGQPVFWFKRPTVSSTTRNEPVVVQRVRRTGNNIYAEIDTPYSWLQSASYPVGIDPTVDTDVSASNCDAVSNGDNSFFSYTYVAGGPQNSSSASSRYHSGYIFTLTGPASGDTIDVAYLTVLATDNFGWGLDGDFDIYCEDVDSAATYETTTSIISRTYTTASVNWVTGSFDDLSTHDSPSVVTPVQQVIDRAGWASGNRINFAFLGKTSGTESLGVGMYDNAVADATALHIEYTAGGGTASLVPQIPLKNIMPSLVR